jgi:hypothetical protein
MTAVAITHDAIEKDEDQVEHDDDAQGHEENNTVHLVDLHCVLNHPEVKLNYDT